MDCGLTSDQELGTGAAAPPGAEGSDLMLAPGLAAHTHLAEANTVQANVA